MAETQSIMDNFVKLTVIQLKKLLKIKLKKNGWYFSIRKWLKNF